MNYTKMIDDMNKKITEKLLSIVNREEDEEKEIEYDSFCEDFEE